ncbi:MAG: peptidyl-tRNA hydrolase Pth2 [Candidatus Aenigmatarchaeota archaeon]
MIYKQVIVVRSDIKLSRGKLAAQVAHASLEAYKLAKKAAIRGWEKEGAKKVILAADIKEIRRIATLAEKLGLPVSVIKDAGRTELKPGTLTCIGIGPAPEREIDKLTGKLKLLK